MGVLDLFDRRVANVSPSPNGQSATRQSTGTTYVTKGAVSDPHMKEIGSQTGSTIIDPIIELGNRQQARKTYKKMVRADASVRVSLRAGKAPVLGAEYYIDPFSSDPEDLAIAELVEYNLFEGMTTPWLKFLEQGLKFLESGFSTFEPCWELREWAPRATTPGANRKKYTMLRKLAVRPPETITKFEYDDNGGPVLIKQSAIRANGKAENVDIEIDKLCIFTFDQDGGDLQGNSILRSAYQHWYYKDHLYKIDAIQKERHGIGVPEVELQPGYSPEDRRIANEMAKNLRTNERAYIVRTTMMHVGFAELKGNVVNALESAEHHDNMIMKNIMVQFLNAASGDSGGRASSATSMDMFLKSMKYIANSMPCDGINMYVIPNLVSYNFKTDRFPKLRVRNIGETKDLQMWAAAMGNLKKNGLIQVDDDTEQWIRKQLDMPKRTSDFVAVTQNGKGNPANVDKRGPTSGNAGKSDSSGAV